VLILAWIFSLDHLKQMYYENKIKHSKRIHFFTSFLLHSIRIGISEL
jgi:hypothetical protein